jgi:hypothetical protein
VEESEQAAWASVWRSVLKACSKGVATSAIQVAYSRAMNWLRKQIAAAPKLALLAGQALFAIGGLLIVCGLIGRVASTAINSTRSISKLPALTGLKDAYPTYVLWWVPERFAGYVVPGLLATVGIYVALLAKKQLEVQRPTTRRRRR